MCCLLSRVVPSGEWGEGLVWLIGAVVCLLAACRWSNCPLTRAVDGRNLRCSTIGSCQSTTTSEIVKRGWLRLFTVQVGYRRIRPSPFYLLTTDPFH